mgnify:CR=1 FL=1
MLFVINGDQNIFVYKINSNHGLLQHLDLQWSSCLYMDEIIDSKFLNENKHAILCSNSETLKLMELSNGKTEIYAGHSDIIITLDVFKCKENTDDGFEHGFLLSGAKDNEIRLWKYDFGKE